MHPNTVEWLLAAGAPRAPRAADGKTPLLLAMDSATAFSIECPPPPPRPSY
jgi:hypothetical protein